MLQSFEEKDELYTFAESINSSKESVSQISLTDSSRQSLVNSRFERLQFMKVCFFIFNSLDDAAETVDWISPACRLSSCLGHV